MSKQSSLLCVVCVLVAVLLAGDHRLAPVPAAAAAAAATGGAQIGDEFFFQDPILMQSHAAGRHELSGAAPLSSREEDHIVADEEEQAFSSGEECTDDDDEEEEEEVTLVGDGRALEPDRSVKEEEIAEGEGHDSLLSVHGADTEASNNSEEHGVECPECGKQFRSDKSMFGHLKSHPDRGYKGATPPPPAKPKLICSPEPPAADGVRPVARCSRRDPNLNAFEVLAAYVMLTLKHRRDDDPPAQPQDRPVSVKAEPADGPPEVEEGSVASTAGADVVVHNENGGSVAEKDAAGEDDTVRRNEHSGSSLVADTAGDDTVRRSEPGGSAAAETGGGDHPARGGALVAKRGRTKRSKEAAQRKEKARRPYVCKHCQAVFPTHQALGGHMAAHNKDRRVQAQNDQAAWEAHHQGLNRQEPRNGGEEPPLQRGGLSAAAREVLMERYTRLFNTGWQTRQEHTGGGYTGTERRDGSSLPPVAAPPVGDGDRRRLFGVDLDAGDTGKE